MNFKARIIKILEPTDIVNVRIQKKSFVWLDMLVFQIELVGKFVHNSTTYLGIWGFQFLTLEINHIASSQKLSKLE